VFNKKQYFPECLLPKEYLSVYVLQIAIFFSVFVTESNILPFVLQNVMFFSSSVTKAIFFRSSYKKQYFSLHVLKKAYFSGSSITKSNKYRIANFRTDKYQAE